MNAFEVEVKSLLGSERRAREILEAMRRIDPKTSFLSHSTQLTNYFEKGTIDQLRAAVDPFLSEDGRRKLADIAARANAFSIRTRNADAVIMLVVKASIGSDTSVNGISRIEFEEKIDMPIETLDEIILAAGFQYQAKWSRERDTYMCRDITVCLDKNAGYGYVAEFEKVVATQAEAQQARAEIAALMQEAGAIELPQDRLERMFAYYNTHWPEYYGTANIFDIQ